MRRKLIYWGVQGGIALVGVVVLLFGISFLRDHLDNKAKAAPHNQQPSHGPRLVGADTVRLEGDVVKSLGVRVATIQTCKNDRGLAPLAGSLAFDLNQIAPVQSRFAGEVMEIGMSATDPKRQIAYGDRVKEGDLLVVVWSKELGEKKSELIAALSQLKYDMDFLAKQEEAFSQGAIGSAGIQTARETVRQDEIKATNAERILVTWRIPEEEIAKLRKNAESSPKPGKSGIASDPKWARVEVRAPMSGLILERNVKVGTMVDTARELFKIGDLSNLKVWAHAYEEDLPRLLALPQPIHWKIRLKNANGTAPLSGSVERISDVIDTTQHTVLVIGNVDNSDGKLRPGQFLTAEVEVPPPGDRVEVPMSALVEDGEESIIFLQPKPGVPEYRLCRVRVLTRCDDAIIAPVATVIGDDGQPERLPLRPGMSVVSSGAVELRTLVDQLRGSHGAGTKSN